jgi:DNA-binding PadR family transcriptional regulator
MRGNLSDLVKKGIIRIRDIEAYTVAKNRPRDMVYRFTDLGLEICKHLAAKGEILQDSQHA